MKTIEVHETKRPCCDKARVAAYVGGLGGALLIMLFMVWLMYHFNKPADPGREQRAGERRKALTEIRGADADALRTYGWSVKDQQVTRIPIDKAMEKSIELWKNPAAARSDLLDRAAKAFPPPPPPPKSEFE